MPDQGTSLLGFPLLGHLPEAENPKYVTQTICFVTHTLLYEQKEEEALGVFRFLFVLSHMIEV